VPRVLGNWIKTYLDYTEKQESPETLHYWTAMSILATAVHRQLYLTRIKYRLYPNLYIVFIGASGKFRKSVAINIGLDLIDEADPRTLHTADRMTPQGLVKFAARAHLTESNGKKEAHFDAACFIHVDELANFLTNDKNRASDMGILLTRLYECPPRYIDTTAGEGQRELRNVYFNLLAATAPQNLKVIPDDAVGGLLGRLILVAGKRSRPPVDWLDPERVVYEAALRNDLVNDLRSITELKGEMFLTPAAKKRWSDWYVAQYNVDLEDPRMDAFQSRFHDLALKLAMLHTISLGDRLEIDEYAVTLGIRTVEDQLKSRGAILQMAGSSDYAQHRAKMLDVLQRAGGKITRKKLMRNMVVPVTVFDELILGFREEGVITARTATRQGDTIYQLVGDPEG